VQAQLDGVVIRLGDVVEIRVNKVSQMPLVWEAGERTTKHRDSSRSHPQRARRTQGSRPEGGDKEVAPPTGGRARRPARLRGGPRRKATDDAIESHPTGEDLEEAYRTLWPQ
jgi:hypothetical protein